MSVDMLISPRRVVKAAALASTPKRVLNQPPEPPPRPASSPGIRKPSAVERLEADKGKYVKSQQVAQTRQQPIVRKPLMSARQCRAGPPGPPQPTRKVPTRPAHPIGAPPLNLEHLNKLINGVSDTLKPFTPTQEEESGGEQTEDPGSGSSTQSTPPTLSQGAEAPAQPRPAAGRPLVVASPAKAAAEAGGAGNILSGVTVRRVDVRPQVPLMRTPCRVPPQPRLQGLSPQQPPGLPAQLLRLLGPYRRPGPLLPAPIKARPSPVNPTPGPLKPPTSAIQPLPPSTTAMPPATSSPPPQAPAPPPTNPTEAPPAPSQPSPAHTPVSPLLPREDAQPPPPSPAITRLSSGSSRKRPSLTRSKSDVSDRLSRAGVELERFFNYCGLDPADLTELTRPGSDITSVTRLRSASAPASERSVDENEEENEEEAPQSEQPSYGISVIERNARVIKWLYGMRQVNNTAKVANI